MRLHKPRTYVRLVKQGLLGKQTIWEPKVWKTLRNLHGKVFVDVGANEGVYALGLRKHFKGIFAYEPNPEFYNRLGNLVRTRQNIHVFPYAISEKDGQGILYLDDSPQRCTGSADTLLQVFEYAPASSPNVKKKTFLGEKGVRVETRRLDTLFHGQLDLVKIDVEGAEFLVLQGAEKLLGKRMIQHLMVELHNREQAEQLGDLFKKHGYQGCWVDPDHYYASVEK